jgi:hypothetical protein
METHWAQEYQRYDILAERDLTEGVIRTRLGSKGEERTKEQLRCVIVKKTQQSQSYNYRRRK